MTTQSERHEALVEEVTAIIAFGTTNDARMDDEIACEVLALILTRLGDVTEEMVEAVAKIMAKDEGWDWDDPEILRDWWISQARIAAIAFVAASPLNGGKEK